MATITWPEGSYSPLPRNVVNGTPIDTIIDFLHTATQHEMAQLSRRLNERGMTLIIAVQDSSMYQEIGAKVATDRIDDFTEIVDEES